MGMSTAPDTQSRVTDDEPALQVARFTALMLRRGARSTAEQAERCGLPRTHLADILAGRKGVGLKTAFKLSKGSGGTVEYLFGEETAA